MKSTNLIALILIFAAEGNLLGQYVFFKDIGEVQRVQAKFDNKVVSAVVEPSVRTSELFVIFDLEIFSTSNLRDSVKELQGALADPAFAPTGVFMVGSPVSGNSAAFQNYAIGNRLLWRADVENLVPSNSPTPNDLLLHLMLNRKRDSEKFAVIEWLNRRAKASASPIRVIWIGDMSWLRFAPSDYVDDFDQLRNSRIWSFSSSRACTVRPSWTGKCWQEIRVRA